LYASEVAEDEDEEGGKNKPAQKERLMTESSDINIVSQDPK
jgi:hypothetical protein